MRINNINHHLKLKVSTFFFLKIKKFVLYIDFKVFPWYYYVSHNFDL